MRRDETSENAMEAANQVARLVASLWARGASDDDIADATGLPLETVCRILKKWQKAIIETEIVPQSKSARIARPSAIGKYAHIPGSSEDFAIEKQKDIAIDRR